MDRQIVQICRGEYKIVPKEEIPEDEFNKLIQLPDGTAFLRDEKFGWCRVHFITSENDTSNIGVRYRNIVRFKNEWETLLAERNKKIRFVEKRIDNLNKDIDKITKEYYERLGVASKARFMEACELNMDEKILDVYDLARGEPEKRI